jgi:hypothetical protein
MVISGTNKGVGRLIASVLVVFVAALVVVCGLAYAQFASPTCVPPGCSPAVIQNIAPTATAQTASINVTGTVRTDGCFGSTYAGFSAVVANVALANGYKSADALCNTAVSGSHACSIDEILKSIKCGVALPASGSGWINGGPPGYTAWSNDCNGWRSNSGTYYGRVWDFNNTSGGSGSMTTCNTPVLPIACCK